MTSNRQRKKAAAYRGLSERELELAELLEEMLEQMRWLWVLAYANQYLVEHHVQVEVEERDSVLEAAARAVDRDGKLRGWQQRLARVKQAAAAIDRGVQRARQELTESADAGGSSAAAAPPPPTAVDARG
jgi:hypothetical protein